jgi:hypothetical protein
MGSAETVEIIDTDLGEFAGPYVALGAPAPPGRRRTSLRLYRARREPDRDAADTHGVTAADDWVLVTLRPHPVSCPAGVGACSGGVWVGHGNGSPVSGVFRCTGCAPPHRLGAGAAGAPERRLPRSVPRGGGRDAPTVSRHRRPIGASESEGARRAALRPGEYDPRD